MKSFGNKSIFSIEYNTYPEMYPDDEEIISDINKYLAYGCIYFWVNGRNIFLFKGFGSDGTYTADLCIFAEFMCKRLVCYLSNDPFPVKTKATTGAAMFEEMRLIKYSENEVQECLEFDWSKVDMSIYRQIDNWNLNHGFLVHRGGTFLPCVFIRNMDNQIEISWDNNFSYDIEEGKLFFEYKEGVEYIDIKVFKEVVVAFCLDIIKLYEDKYPQAAKRDRDNLQKAIDFEV